MGCAGADNADDKEENLEITRARRIAAAMPDMGDDQIVTANVVVDKERIAGRRKYAHTGNIRFASKSGMIGQQSGRHAYLIDDRGGCARTVLRNVFVNFGDVGAGTRRVP